MVSPKVILRFDDITLKVLVDFGYGAIFDGYGFSTYLGRGILHIPQLAFKPYKFVLGISILFIYINLMRSIEISNLHGEQIRCGW